MLSCFLENLEKCSKGGEENILHIFFEALIDSDLPFRAVKIGAGEHVVSSSVAL